MFRVSTTPIIRSTQNCNYSLRYCTATSLQRGQAWPRWREVAAQKIWPVPEAVVTVLCTPDDWCGWHLKHVEWTCRIVIDCFVLHLVGKLLTCNVPCRLLLQWIYMRLCLVHYINSIRMITLKSKGWVGLWHARERRKMYTEFWWTKLSGKDTFDFIEIEKG